MIAKFAPAFQRWIDRAKNVALLGAVGAGCIYGYAYAIAPTVDADRDFAGAVTVFTAVSYLQAEPAYTVPAGRQYTLTDVIISNPDAEPHYAYVSAGSATNCTGSNATRLDAVLVPAQASLHLPLVTGIGFGAGKTVCLNVSGVSYFNLRGYLSNDR